MLKFQPISEKSAKSTRGYFFGLTQYIVVTALKLLTANLVCLCVINTDVMITAGSGKLISFLVEIQAVDFIASF